MLVLVAVVAPIPFALLWGRQWTAGLIAGYSFWIVVLGFTPSWVAYQLYRLAELIVQLVTRRRPATPKAGERGTTADVRQAVDTGHDDRRTHLADPSGPGA